MRLNECDQVKKDLSEHLGINLTVVDASQVFLDGLKGIEDPEKKRKFIGMFSARNSYPFIKIFLVFVHGTRNTGTNLF